MAVTYALDDLLVHEADGGTEAGLVDVLQAGEECVVVLLYLFTQLGQVGLAGTDFCHGGCQNDAADDVGVVGTQAGIVVSGRVVGVEEDVAFFGSLGLFEGSHANGGDALAAALGHGFSGADGAAGVADEQADGIGAVLGIVVVTAQFDGFHAFVFHIGQVVFKCVLDGKSCHIGVTAAAAQNVGAGLEDGQVDDFLDLCHTAVKLVHGQGIHIHALGVEAVLEIEFSVMALVFQSSKHESYPP